jgi:BirA family biotin operon repressor/biotin-[acetyl-CoA-carboxylase] ligase
MAITRGSTVDVNDVEETFLTHLDGVLAALVEGNAPIIDRWRTHLTTLGREITVHTRDSVTQGKAVGVDDQGALLLRVTGGAVYRMMEGDVTLRG